MRIIYLLASTGLCGGVRVVLSHVTGLADRGHQAEVWHLDADPSGWFGRPVPNRRFGNLDTLGVELRKVSGAVKVATWWQTASWVAECLNPGDRGYYLVQDIETSYAGSPAEEEAVLKTYRLGLTPITEGRWVHGRLLDMGLTPVYVGIGLDHQVYRPLPMVRDRNRLFTQYRTWAGGGPKDLKGWKTTHETVLHLARFNPNASVVTFSVQEPPRFPPHIPHVHVQGPLDAKLRELYCQAGVFLMASNHEGFCLTALEAMACGCPVVATRADGNEEFCLDGETALLASPGEPVALARACARVQQDADLAARLSAAGRTMARRYRWEDVIDALAEEFALWTS